MRTATALANLFRVTCCCLRGLMAVSCAHLKYGHCFMPAVHGAVLNKTKEMHGCVIESRTMPI